ncbi:hypothetical protein [Streptomyces sp. NBC_01264]|uniref:hypothetical protein n=1 Tax=Streptomyces sp. NBC_01264 TaxID=2903804 RepID=UPI0022540333|nr:hypothetical protein [Streptomyces sp. NBC_01264]MCX4778166.1 hypothetical protein [Streptomyces sp. NBC_01264]
MSVLIQGSQLRMIGLGTKVDRATAALPQTTTGNLFAVTGGRILLTSIVGEVTTVIQTQANNTKLVSTPTTGTAVDICAVLDISADEAGCLYGITGVFSDALVGANAGATTAQQRATVIPVGNIKLSCAASNTGSVKWSMTYIPLDDGASVAAA